MSMEKERKLPKRKPTRLHGFDYSSAGAYFITICTQNRRCILSSIVGGDVLDAPQSVKLLPHGSTVEKQINQFGNFYDDIKVDAYVIMPNHIHMLLLVSKDGASRTSPPTRQHARVSRLVSTLKRFCNKEFGENVWQRHFYDHIIRDAKDYEEHLKYIHENPARWYYDTLYTENKPNMGKGAES